MNKVKRGEKNKATAIQPKHDFFLTGRSALPFELSNKSLEVSDRYEVDHSYHKCGTCTST